MPPSTFTSISSSRTPVVYANKGSRLIAAVQSFYPTEVNVHPLSELMMVRPEVDVPTLTSFWLDLPQKGLPNCTSFIDHISKIVKQCRRFTVPFCIITANRPTVNSRDETQVPAWKEFIVSNNVSWTTQCSCQYQCGRFQSLHFKVKVYAFNTVPFWTVASVTKLLYLWGTDRLCQQDIYCSTARSLGIYCTPMKPYVKGILEAWRAWRNGESVHSSRGKFT